MHDMGWIIPVAFLTIIALRKTATTWIRAKHGYPLDEPRRTRTFGGSELGDTRQMGLLSDENAQLKAHVSRLEERIHVLERIATDGRHSNNLAAEIESLRDR